MEPSFRDSFLCDYLLGLDPTHGKTKTTLGEGGVSDTGSRVGSRGVGGVRAEQVSISLPCDDEYGHPNIGYD